MVFDIVDSWAQPDDGLRYSDLSGARAFFSTVWGDWPKIHSFIFPNRAMQRDLSSLVRHSTCIYHHYRPGISVNPIRRAVATIGYEGNVGYLGEWRAIIEDVSTKRGLNFVVNPENLSQADLVFIARGGVHGSYMAHRYKSNVKLANALGSGSPCLALEKEWSCHETDTGDVRFFANREQLEVQLNVLLDQETRRSIHKNFMLARHAFAIDRIANDFEAYFLRVAHLHSAGRL